MSGLNFLADDTCTVFDRMDKFVGCLMVTLNVVRKRASSQQGIKVLAKLGSNLVVKPTSF